jgi:hypothetical protein
MIRPEPVEENLSAILEDKFILWALISTVAIAAARHTVERCLIGAFQLLVWNRERSKDVLAEIAHCRE